MAGPSSGRQVQKFFIVESNGQETKDLPRVFLFKNESTGCVQEDPTWIVSGNGGCFLKLPETVVDALKGSTPGRLDPDRLEQACRDHNDTFHVPPFREDWGHWQWYQDRKSPDLVPTRPDL